MNMQKTLCIIIYSLIFCIPSNAHADPQITDISGNIEDGQAVIIHGTDFRTHPNFDQKESGYLMAWWDNFESYTGITEGSYPLSSRWNWTENGESRMQISPARARGHQSWYRDGSGTGTKLRQGSENEQKEIFNDSGILYFSMWFYLPSDFTYDIGQQWKLVRFFDGVLTDGGNEDFYPGIAQTLNLGHHSDYDCINGTCISTTSNWFRVTSDNVQGEPFRGRWHRLEVMADVARDELIYKIDGHVYYDGNERYGYNLFPSDWDMHGITFASIDEVKHSHPQMRGWFDDVYANNTWARVEISNSDFIACDREEKIIKNLQLPITWDNDTITIDLNLEGLSEQAYLFVIDENGNASDAFPITIGELSGDGPSSSNSGDGTGGSSGGCFVSMH